MKYITYLNILAKSIFTVAIFVFVHEQSDFWIVPLLTSVGFIIAGILSLWIVKKEFNVNFRLQKMDTLKNTLIDGWHVFISNIAISLYTVSTTFILGLFTNNTIVGYFSAADKIITAFKGLIKPISQTLYPYISKKVKYSKKDGLLFIRKATKYIGIFTGFISVFIFIFAEFIVNLLLGSEYQNSIMILKIMSILPLLIGLSNIFGIQTMVTFGRKKAFSKVLITGSILNLILSFILVPLYHHYGSAVSVVAVESFITIAMFMYLQKNGLKIIGEVKNV
jgi:PST family polysaccharide transporter